MIDDETNPHYAHPVFWAPFVVIGEGGTYGAIRKAGRIVIVLLADEDGGVGELTFTNEAGTVTLNEANKMLQIDSEESQPKLGDVSETEIQSLFGPTFDAMPSDTGRDGEEIIDGPDEPGWEEEISEFAEEIS